MLLRAGNRLQSDGNNWALALPATCDTSAYDRLASLPSSRIPAQAIS